MNLKRTFEPLRVRVTHNYEGRSNVVRLVDWQFTFQDLDSGDSARSMGITALPMTGETLLEADLCSWGDLEQAVVATEGGARFLQDITAHNTAVLEQKSLEEGLTSFDNITPPINSLSSLKTRLRRDIDAVRDRKIAEGVEYQGIVYDSDATSTQRIMGTVQLMREGGMESREWIAQDNTTHLLAVEDFVQIGSLISAWEERCVFVSRQGKDAVIAATTFSEAEAAKRNCVDMLQALTQS